jgi:hypothetical protein
MITSVNQYVPCLRWKQGEYLALSRLTPATKQFLKPLIEIPEIGYDFETHSESKTIDEHLAKLARRVEANWGLEYCFVDIHLIGPSERMKTGQHPLAFVFDELRHKVIMAVPVIDLKQDSDCQSAISEITSIDKRGACARINIEEAAKNDLRNSLDSLLHKYHIGTNECDFILDLGAPNFVPIDGFASLLTGLINRIPYLNEWRSFVLIGTSFPKSMAEVPRDLSIRPRYEWQLYKLLIEPLSASGIRIPIFGDYAINHPDVISLDMRLIKPYASLRYTIDDSYLIIRGLNVRDHKYHQYREMCRELTRSKYYCGENFSQGDKYIEDCAQGVASTGKLTTWRWVGTNHHLEKVVRDISNLFAL